MEKNIIINIPLDEFEELQKEWIKEVLGESILKETEDVLLTRFETAELLGISLVTLNVYTKKGIVQGFRVGTRIRYKKSQVMDCLKETNKYERRRNGTG